MTNSVQALVRALDIIEAISDRGGELSISEISKATNLGKSTVHRLLKTLSDEGYIKQNKDNGKYLFTLKLFEIGCRIANTLDVKKIALPYIKELALVTKETVNLGVLDKNEILYVEKIETEELLRIELKVGGRVPVFCSGLGKVILAYLDDGERDKFLSSLTFQRYTDKTITDKVMYNEHLDKIKSQGYALDDEEYIPGLRCIAAPIFHHSGKIHAAVSIAGPTVRLTNERIETLYPLIVKTADNISRNLGFTN